MKGDRRARRHGTSKKTFPAPLGEAWLDYPVVVHGVRIRPSDHVSRPRHPSFAPVRPEVRESPGSLAVEAVAAEPVIGGHSIHLMNASLNDTDSDARRPAGEPIAAHTRCRTERLAER